MLLDMMAFGMIIPVLPKLIESFVGGDTAKAAQVVGVFGTVWALMQFVSMPVVGALSDQLGRRPVILLSVTGLGLDFVLMALAPNLWWLLLGRIISGITSANFSTSSAYIADVTPPERRAAGFGLLGAAFGVGFVLGPALGGLLGTLGPRMPFWVAAACALANAAWGVFVLPESLPVERRTPFSWRRANPVAALAMLRERRELRGLAGVKFLMDLAQNVLPSTFVLYTGYRFGWTKLDVGLVLCAVGVTSILVQAGLVGPVVRRLGEGATLSFGLVFGIVSYAVYGLSPTGVLFLVGLPLGAIMGLAGPALQGLATRRVSPTEQGRLQGALASVQGVAQMIGPTIFGQTLSLFISPMAPMRLPGAAFLVGALVLVAALLVSTWERRRAVLPQLAEP